MQTLEIARELQQAGINETSAYKIAETINGKSGLATKEDLLKLEQALGAKIHNVEKNLEGKIYGLDKTFEGKIYEAKEEVTKKILEIEKSLEGQIHAVKEDIGKLETSNKWIVAILFIMFGMMVKLFIDSFQ